MTLHELLVMLEDLPDETIIKMDTANGSNLFDRAKDIKECIICKQLDADPVVYLSPEDCGVW